MSSISHKKPGFSQLNTRKTEQKTVGNTIGERKERLKAADAEQSLSWVQRAKDKFLGGKKQNNIKEFSNSHDRFSPSSNSITEHNRRLENGSHRLSKTAKPASDQYVRFLDSIITYLDQKPKKV